MKQPANLFTKERVTYPLSFSWLLTLSCIGLVSCASERQVYQVEGQRLTSNVADLAEQAETTSSLIEQRNTPPAGFTTLKPLTEGRGSFLPPKDMASAFSDQARLSFSADKTPGREFLHTVFGEQLQVNYVIADGTEALDAPVSLNLQQTVSPRQLFVLVSELLAGRNIAITLKDDVYFIHAKDDNTKPSSAIGFGRRIQDVPQSNGLITQFVPVKFNKSFALVNTINQLSGANGNELPGQSAFYFQGERSVIIKALELMQVMDVPQSAAKNIGLVRLSYMSSTDFVTKVHLLLGNEGLGVAIGAAVEKNIALVPIEHLGAIVVFAADESQMQRVHYWQQQLDQPSQSNDKQYFIYHPRYARSSDLGSSVAALLGQASSQTANQSRDTQSAQPQSRQNQNGELSAVPKTTPSSNSSNSAVSVSNEKLTMTVDQRSNSLIFYTTGKEYQQLLPMIQRLDVMPKQILLEATIAEVTLTDEFAMGLEFAIRNGKFATGTTGAFGVSDMGGMSLSYINGVDRVLAQLRSNDTRFNILSNPSIVVRDGVQASILVGDDVPTVGATTTNPNFESQTTTVVYRKTGVDLTVTPTISAQGLVVLQISQNISNAVDGGISVEGSPSFFERAITTEVIAQSGQSILLGGLISENNSSSKSAVPLLSDLPLLGALFKGQKESKKKTELVILITPRVLDSTAQWQHIKDNLDSAMQLLKITD